MSSQRAEQIPNHVGVIMDGNGRWAVSRGLPRVAGHHQGAESVKKFVRAAKDAGVKELTLFAFSLENWKRPQDEVSELMELLRRYLKSETKTLKKEGARLRVIGDRSLLAQDIVEMIEVAEEETKSNSVMTVAIAVSYGGRDEIFKASQAFAKKCIAEGLDPETQDINNFTTHLMTNGMSDPDLIIRTSGEQRISNFLLWQSAYTEYYFSDKNWPDFDENEFREALKSYQQRNRRYGVVEKREISA